MLTNSIDSPARPRVRGIVLTVQLNGFDILFFHCKCVSLEIALRNFSPVATRVWQNENETTEIPQITAHFGRFAR
jgi:hypothetical protein